MNLLNQVSERAAVPPRRPPGVHLDHNAAQAPDIDVPPIFLLRREILDDLRRHEVRRPGEGNRLDRVRKIEHVFLNQLRAAEVGQFDVSVSVGQQVGAL